MLHSREGNMQNCIFCKDIIREIIAENKLARAFYDKFPVNKGHVLITPKRHVESYFEATKDELKSITELIFEVKDILQTKYAPDGYNIGVNVGSAAGQTIFHLHIHIIPRFKGDVEDPRGGVRKIKKSIVPYELEGERL